MGQSELSENLGSVMGEATRYARWNFLPQNPTLKHYIEVLLDSPEYFVMFWNSIKVVMGTLVGQCAIAIPAAWGFAVYKFKWCAQLRVCSQAGGIPVYPRFSQPDNSESWDDAGNGI